MVGSSLCLFLPSRLDKRKIILITNFFLIPGLFCSGPSSLLHFPNFPALLLVGLGIAGFSVGVSKTLALVEAVDGGVAMFPSQNSSVSLSVSRFLNIKFGFVSLICPPLSSVLNKYIGFSKTLDCLSLLFLLYFVCLLVWSIPDMKESQSRPHSTNDEEVDLLS